MQTSDRRGGDNINDTGGMKDKVIDNLIFFNFIRRDVFNSRVLECKYITIRPAGTLPPAYVL